MSRTTRLLATAGLLAACALPALQARAAQPVTALEHVRLLAMDGGTAREGWTVVVEAGRIRAVGADGHVPIPDDARRIDGQGHTLMPGLIDMHVHVPPGPAAEGDPAWRTLGLLLANGVTTTRSMAGHPDHVALRDRIAAGDVAGPRLVIAAPSLNDQNTKSAADARAKVVAARKAGFELVKSHHLTDPAVWQAVQDEARVQGLPVGGHVTSEVGLERALAAGQQIEHMDGFVGALLREDAPERTIPFGQLPPPEVLAAVDPVRLPVLARRIVDGGHAVVPTLALFEAAFGGMDVEALAARPEMRYLHADARAAWLAQAKQMAAHPAIAAVGPGFVALRRDMVRALADAGAPLMAGSDSPQNFMVAGFALHRELESLVAAGLTPTQALETATRHPAAYLSKTAPAGTPIATAPPLGTIAPGAAADLLLVDGRPDRDIAATRNIVGVMHDGRWLDRAALDALLEAVAASTKVG